MGVDGDQKHGQNLINFQFHLHPHHDYEKKGDLIPKGFLAILVGRGEEEQRRFVIPVIYVNHPLFTQLLTEAEEEYGFDQRGPITIPCLVDQFRSVQDTIDKENSIPHNHNLHLPDWCFRPSVM